MGQLLTFQDQYLMGQQLAHFSDSTTTTKLKRDINTGCARLMAGLDRAYLRRNRFTDLEAGQQYYQYPEDALKLRQFVTHIGSINLPLIEITDEEEWDRMNQVPVQGIPWAFFIKGMTEVGLYPIPEASTSSGGELVFTQRHVAMTQDDYTTGTVTVANGSQTVVGVGTTWTSAMAGRGFEVTDGSDGNWYRILSVESTTSLTLENFDQGISNSGLAYRIGECASLPEEYLESPVDYALNRFYLGRDQAKQAQYLGLFTAAFEDMRSVYGRKASSNVIDASTTRVPMYDPLRSNISINT